MFNCLEKAAEHAVKFDSRKDGMYTAFMVNKVELSVNDAYKNYTENQCCLLYTSWQRFIAHRWARVRLGSW